MFVESGPSPDSGKMLPDTQAKHYPRILGKCFSMPRKPEDHLAAALEAFSRGTRTLMDEQRITSDSALHRIVKQRVPGGPSRKTVNNALEGRHDAQLSTLHGIAEALNCPLWVLVNPDLKATDIQSPFRERLVALVRNYLQCDDASRTHVESLAAAFAAKNQK